MPGRRRPRPESPRAVSLLAVALIAAVTAVVPASTALPGSARRMATTAVLLGLVVSAFEATVVTSAMPTLTRELGGQHLYSWVFSSYLFASTLMTSNDKLPANPAVFLLMGHMGTESWGLLMAAAITIILPVLILFFMAQRWLVSGLTDGAVKG